MKAEIEWKNQKKNIGTKMQLKSKKNISKAKREQGKRHKEDARFKM